jgi:1-aminocyclopropane-1-carboxylate deaminase/D-cysteine desulfhydrase-like pyridoxal-dependent ACC family enzyme
MTIHELTSRLAAQPARRLAVLPTPLEDAPRLREALGGRARCPRILVKRDDLTGLGLGGNKARKLDFLIGDALARGATSVTTTGAAQSNHARMTAAAARRAGLAVDLVLTTADEPAPLEGNLLLDHLFGARVHMVPAVDPMLAVGHDEAVVRQVAEALVADGGRPYVIAVGGSSAVGALGYVAGTVELAGQLAALGVAPRRVYFASGSRGTQAGLTLGAHLLALPYDLHGVAVSGGEPEKPRRSSAPTPRCARPASSPIRASSATAMGCQHRRASRRCGSPPAPKPWCWTPPTPPRVWPHSSRTSALASSALTTRWCSSTPEAPRPRSRRKPRRRWLPPPGGRIRNNFAAGRVQNLSTVCQNQAHDD